MPTVQEILRQSGLSDEQITALDQRAMSAFGGVLNAATEASKQAEQEREAAAQTAQQAEADRKAALAAKEQAELERRANKQFYDETIVPSLNDWGNKQTALEAQVAFYKAQNESARSAGFVPTEAPQFEAAHPAPSVPGVAPNPNQPRDPNNGRYVSGAPGGVPGSPTFTLDQIDQRLGTGLSNIGWAMQEYGRLSGGQFLPDSFDTLAMEATNNRLPFRDYVARKYDFAGKQSALQKKQQEEYDAKIRAEAVAPFEAKIKETEAAGKRAIEENERKWAERVGNNPDVRIAQPSRFADVSRAVKNNERPDPLSLNIEQRRQATANAIRQEIATNSAESAA